MSIDNNIDLIRRYFDECASAVGGSDRNRALALVDELLSPDFVMQYNNEPVAEVERGRDRHKQFLIEHSRDFPDDRWTVEAVVADEHVAACSWRIEARHAKTGNAIDVRAADFYTIRDGRLAEMRRFLDFASLQEQVRPRTNRSRAHSRR
jgi:ketosteroid isomerase-like protein